MSLATAATVAATAASAMYLDGRWALRKDLTALTSLAKLNRVYARAEKEKRISMYYLFEGSAKLDPSGDAIWSREGCYTWQEAYDRTNQYAQWYLSQGVKPHDLVSIYMTNSPDFVFSWLGLWAVGAAPTMINYNLSGNALIHCLKVAGSSLLLVDDDEALLGRIEKDRVDIEGLGQTIHVLDGALKQKIYSQPKERPADSYREVVKGDWPVSIFYTSGTTGLPKGVPFKHDRLFTSGGAGRLAGVMRTIPGDRWYNCMPMYHGTGGIVAMSNLINGTTLCIGKRFSTSKFWPEVRDSKATYITYVGETARYLLAAPPSPLDKEHNVRCMYGNGLRPDVWIKFRERFDVPEVWEFFNSSEGVFAMINHCRGDYLAGAVGHHGALVRLLTRNTMVPVLIDQDTGAIARDPKTGFARRQPYDQGGEMIVAVEDTSVFAGYFKNPEATKKKFETNVFKKGDLWYRSGDALRRTDDGRWYFLDRLGDTFRWKGENVSTAEVAEVLGRYPGVVEANVYGVALPSHDGRAGCAAVYIDPSGKESFDFAGLLKHARKHLPRYAVPIFIRIVKEMTPIHNNKQNKVPLRAEGVDPSKVKPEDKVLWVSDNGKGHTYVDFHKDHWEDLQLGKASL